MSCASIFKLAPGTLTFKLIFQEDIPEQRMA